jgi:hypothetical protein
MFISFNGRGFIMKKIIVFMFVFMLMIVGVSAQFNEGGAGSQTSGAGNVPANGHPFSQIIGPYIFDTEVYFQAGVRVRNGDSYSSGETATYTYGSGNLQVINGIVVGGVSGSSSSGGSCTTNCPNICQTIGTPPNPSNQNHLVLTNPNEKLFQSYAFESTNGNCFRSINGNDHCSYGAISTCSLGCNSAGTGCQVLTASSSVCPQNYCVSVATSQQFRTFVGYVLRSNQVMCAYQGVSCSSSCSNNIGCYDCGGACTINFQGGAQY